ncbi:hypothetical protein HK098_001989 [Nowakowskiella sp. JEL0407]|nr:hypothetical protein HK098_001989 [Nowakowskiella sp. JEL0407]
MSIPILPPIYSDHRISTAGTSMYKSINHPVHNTQMKPINIFGTSDHNPHQMNKPPLTAASSSHPQNIQTKSTKHHHQNPSISSPPNYSQLNQISAQTQNENIKLYALLSILNTTQDPQFILSHLFKTIASGNNFGDAIGNNQFEMFLSSIMDKRSVVHEGGDISLGSSFDYGASGNVNHSQGRNGEDMQFTSQMAASVFERLYIEAQKLLERARNSDLYQTFGSSANLALEDRDKKRKTPKETQTSGGYELGGGVLDGNPAGMGLKKTATSLAGRKPLRVIAAELANLELRALEAKTRPRISMEDIFKQNKALITSMQPDNHRRLLLEAKIANQNHRKQVFEKKKQIESQNLKKKLEVLRKKEDTVEQGKKKEKEEMGRAQTLQRKWFIVVVIASRLQFIRNILEEVHSKKQIYMKQNRSSFVIQKAWKRYKLVTYQEKVKWALAKISRVFRNYVYRRREQKKHESSNTIRQFFRDVHDVSKLMKIVKKYRFSGNFSLPFSKTKPLMTNVSSSLVIKAQTYLRTFLEIRDAQIQVIIKYWDKVEPLWWAQRKNGVVAGANGIAGVGKNGKSGSMLNIAEQAAKEKGAKNKKTKPGKKKEEVEKEKVMFLKVTDAIKCNVIKEDLITRRKAFRREFGRWQERLSKFGGASLKRTTLHKADKEDEEEFRKPIFKLLPSLSDMHSLIEKGFLESATSLATAAATGKR